MGPPREISNPSRCQGLLDSVCSPIPGSSYPYTITCFCLLPQVLLRDRAADSPAGDGADPSVAQEIERIERAIRKDDKAVLVEYGGLNPVIHRCGALEKLPTAAETGENR